MDDRVDGLLRKDLLQTGFVPHIPFVNREGFAGKRLYPPDDFGLGVAVVVQHHNIVTGGQHFQTGVAANISASACNKYCHFPHSLL